jgi:O-antigen/teichoic acid export membrane protein
VTKEPAGFQPPSFVSSALFTFGTQIAVAVLSLVNVLIVARALGPTGRGQIALLTTIAYLSSQVALFGVEQANINLAGIQPRSRRALATNSLILATAFGACAIGFLAGLIAIFPGVGGGLAAGLRWLSLASIPLLIFQTYLLLLIRADYRFAFANAGSMVGPIVNVGVNGLLASLGAISVGTAFGAWVGGQALGTLLFVWCVQYRAAGFGRPDLGLARQTLGFGLRAHGGRIMMLGNYRLDQWLVGAVSGTRELGVYSVAVAWAEALFHLPTALAAVQRPHLVRASRRETARSTALVFRAAVLITLPIAGVMVAAAPILCVTIFGADFRGSIGELRVLAGGAFGILALKILGNALTAQQKPLLETAGIGAAFIATVVLDILLIPRSGGFGAAIASSVAYSTGGIFIALISTRALGGRLGNFVPRPRDLVALWRGTRGALRRGTSAAPALVPAPLSQSADEPPPPVA